MTKVTLPAVDKPAIIFVPGEQSWQQYGRYFTLQSPLLNEDLIFARDQGKHNVPNELPPLANTSLEKYLPERNLYLYHPEKNRIKKIN